MRARRRRPNEPVYLSARYHLTQNTARTIIIIKKRARTILVFYHFFFLHARTSLHVITALTNIIHCALCTRVTSSNVCYDNYKYIYIYMRMNEHHLNVQPSPPLGKQLHALKGHLVNFSITFMRVLLPPLVRPIF